MVTLQISNIYHFQDWFKSFAFNRCFHHLRGVFNFIALIYLFYYKKLEKECHAKIGYILIVFQQVCNFGLENVANTLPVHMYPWQCQAQMKSVDPID
jgi:hypothetical protein